MSPTAPSAAVDSTLSAEGYKKTLGRRHVTMIAMGGAIGVGLFMGAGGRLASTGPALIFSYAIAGVIAYLLMRALGELVMYRQTSGSFVSYSGEMFGKKGAYLAGWMYFINWGMTGIAELIAIGLYFQFFFPNVPVEVSAIAALALLVAVNLLSVKAFGEFEFWASCLKVGAILIFLAVGTFMVVTNARVGDGHASVANLFAADGGLFPKGALVMVLVLNAVIFAYNGIELVGITAGEMQNPEREVPKAIRAVVLRIVVFYVGSVTLLAMLLPSDQYKAGTSPFVTVFGQMGLGWVGDVMNMVVITAALSSCNSGLYSIGRVFRTMANNGHARSGSPGCPSAMFRTPRSWPSPRSTWWASCSTSGWAARTRSTSRSTPRPSASSSRGAPSSRARSRCGTARARFRAFRCRDRPGPAGPGSWACSRLLC